MKCLGLILFALAVGAGIAGEWCSTAALTWASLEAWTWNDDDDDDADHDDDDDEGAVEAVEVVEVEEI